MPQRQPEPIIPRNQADPMGIDPIGRRAMADFRRRYNEIARRVIAIVDAMNPTAITVNAVRYVYDINPATIDYVMRNISDVVDELLGDGGPNDTWFFEAYVKPAYALGTAQTFANLARQSPAYRAGAMSARDIMMSGPYTRRMALVQAREFELMKGVIGQTKSDLARILTDGIGRGKGPREIAKTIRTETGMSIGRAERIARTETGMALKRARLDESDAATEAYGIKTKQMHLSALSPTTRRDHASRHGNLYTTDEVREWYSKKGNAINCKCSQSEVMVGEDGKPLVPTIEARVKQAREKYYRENPLTEDED